LSLPPKSMIIKYSTLLLFIFVLVHVQGQGQYNSPYKFNSTEKITPYYLPTNKTTPHAPIKPTSTPTPTNTPSPTPTSTPALVDDDFCTFYHIQNVRYNLSALRILDEQHYYNGTFEYRMAGVFQKFNVLFSVCPEPVPICQKLIYDTHEQQDVQACHVFRRDAYSVGQSASYSFNVEELTVILSYKSMTTNSPYELVLRLRCDYGSHFHIMSTNVVSSTLYQININTRHACPINY